MSVGDDCRLTNLLRVAEDQTKGIDELRELSRTGWVAAESKSESGDDTSRARFAILRLFEARKGREVLDVAEMWFGAGCVVRPWFLSMGCVVSDPQVLTWVCGALSKRGVDANAKDYCMHSHTPLHALIGYHTYSPESMELLLRMPFAAEWMKMRTAHLNFDPLGYATYMCRADAMRRLLQFGADPLQSIPSIPTIITNELTFCSRLLCRAIRSAVRALPSEQDQMNVWADLLLVHFPGFLLNFMLSNNSEWSGFWEEFVDITAFARIVKNRAEAILAADGQRQPNMMDSLMYMLSSHGAFGKDPISIHEVLTGSPFEDTVTSSLLGGVRIKEERGSIGDGFRTAGLIRTLLFDPCSVDANVRKKILRCTAHPIPWQSDHTLDMFPILLKYGVNAGGLESAEDIWSSVAQCMHLEPCIDRVKSLVWVGDMGRDEIRRRLAARLDNLQAYGEVTRPELLRYTNEQEEIHREVNEILLYRDVLRPSIHPTTARAYPSRFPLRVRIEIISFLVVVPYCAAWG